MLDVHHVATFICRSFVFQSLTAPSPTVCTKEAMNIVMGMFNSSLNIDKNLGWDDGGTETVSLPQQSGKDKWL